MKTLNDRYPIVVGAFLLVHGGCFIRPSVPERPAVAERAKTLIFPWSDAKCRSDTGTGASPVVTGARTRWAAREAAKDYLRQHFPSGFVRTVESDISEGDDILIGEAVEKGHVTRVSFRVPGWRDLPETGMWRLSRKGVPDMTGSVRKWLFSRAEEQGWGGIVGELSGDLVYQDDEVGLLAWGPIQKGRFEGIWFKKFGNGSLWLISYTHGKRNGPTIFWSVPEDRGVAGSSPESIAVDEWNYKNERLHGWIREWFANGRIAYAAKCNNGLGEGVTRQWYSNGRLRTWVQCKNGEQHGISKTWSREGQLILRERYSYGTLVESSEKGLRAAESERQGTSRP